MTEEIDLVNHPSHYEKCRIVLEPVDLTERLPHALASAIEYILRSPYKGTEKLDLQKAIWWLKRFRDVYLDLIAAQSDYPLTSMTSVVMSMFCSKNETLNSLVECDTGTLYISVVTVNRTIIKLERRIAEIEMEGQKKDV